MAAADLSRRSGEAELMDGPGLGFEEFERCLRELERINRWTFAYRPTLAWLDRLARSNGHPGRPLRILDAGSGGGDMLRRIAAWARRRRLAVELTGADLNPWSARAAERATPAGLAIRYLTTDVFDLPGTGRWDAVVCALFAHHLDDDRLVRFLAWMDGCADRGWFVNDLHRHPVAHAAARAMVATLPVGRLVAHDAPLSVARAFTRADWARLLAAAGLEDRARVEGFVPFRLCVGSIR